MRLESNNNFRKKQGILCFFFPQDDIDVEVTVEIKSGESAFLNLSISSGKICANFTIAIQ